MAETFENRLKAEAQRLGFSLVGIAPAADADTFALYEQWLDAGYAGEMDYLHEHRDKKKHPSSLIANVRSVVMLGYEYADGPPIEQLPPPMHGKVARYAQGPDYHDMLWKLVNKLGLWLQRERPGCRTRGVTDTAPLLERDFARRAGLGWIGKNTMLIHPQHGSFFFLAGLLTDIELKQDQPFTETHCGTCTACLDACPTSAFPQPGTLDATKCISYLTIEHRSAIPSELRGGVGDWLFGCDVCQDVCPWNRFTQDGPFPHEANLSALDCIELLKLSEDEFRKRFRATSLWRTKRSGLLRNAALVLGNQRDKSALTALRQSLADRDALVREAAAWAIERINASA